MTDACVVTASPSIWYAEVLLRSGTVMTDALLVNVVVCSVCETQIFWGYIKQGVSQGGRLTML